MPSQGTRNAQETRVLRQQTKWYIEDGPFQIILTPYTESKTSAGGKIWTAGFPRPPQTVRLVPFDRQRSTTRNFLSSDAAGGSGVQTQVDFKVVGEYNLQIERYDRFTGPDGMEYEVVEVVPVGSAPYIRRAFVRGSPRRDA